MKRFLLLILLICIFNIGYSQKTFPYNVQLKDTVGYNVSSKTFKNFGKPIIIEYFGTYCKPCIDLLDSFEEVHKNWRQKYGVKIIVIVTDVKSKRSKKKLLKMIKEHGWTFQFYLDTEKKLFKKMTNTNVVPQTFIYDGNFNLLGKFKGVKPNYGFKVIDGKVTKEKVKINFNGKYSHLECNLIEYENTLEYILENTN